MPGPAVDIIRNFGAVEDDQRYTRLVDLFTDDAVYYDPFHGAQRGLDQIRDFMELMERVVPGSGIRFLDWEVEADTVCGWAKWTMAGPGPDGIDVPVPGQSLYRLRDGKVCFVADYVDPVAMAQLRPGGPVPNAAAATGLSAPFAPAAAPGELPAHDLVRRFWQLQDGGDYAQLAPLFADDALFEDPIFGDIVGGAAIAAFMEQMKTEMPARGVTFELVDAAGDQTVAWSQWNIVYAPSADRVGGIASGWTLHTVRDGLFTYDRDIVDSAAARAARVAPGTQQ
ncbi:MAG: nuclear transport factor 2 family protein [Ilumatobacteraceae bacterium]